MSNKFPMTCIRFHFFYIALILFLGYKYFSKTQDLNALTKSLESSCKQQLLNMETSSTSNDGIINQIERNAQKSPKFYPILNNAQKVMAEAQAVKKLLSNYRKDFLALCSSEKQPIIGNPYGHNHTTAFFTDSLINNLRLQLNQLQAALKIGIDSVTAQELFKHYQLPQLLNDSEYWRNLNKLNHIQTYSELVRIENIVSTDIVFYLNYALDYAAFPKIIACFNRFRIAIILKKVTLIERESAEGIISLYYNIPFYEQSPDSLVSIKMNGQNLPIKDGIAYFKTSPLSIGKKVIKAEVKVKNIYTGDFMIEKDELEYEVLPLCSRNCQ